MINYTNPDRERFVNIAAMALFIPIKNFITSVLTHVDLQQAINVYLK